ncbi:molybdate ABC transporter substrate-binding protein [Octadecabacter sp. G9-8]|uniref:Molybdate ABC transporter substrate-binding protein n=1 Tax=Octadecabacter dasysiphoniae TaxID=2909341 RepID=A0ABS9CRG4_9RHOB|nr:molybdate ABC transporter substrate-binding protein [Octadecabacter dasysiphoniae]MCF2869828.1 molybdate ABC transporter substrate-binding protein [Octadecabacter dasysiphoniae]
MKRIPRRALWIAGFCIGVPCSVTADDITVFAASSLRDALGTVAAEYEAETDVTVTLVFAASSAIARQVAQGAPADVVLLADQAWGHWLIDEGIVQKVDPFASNRLVMVARDQIQVDRQNLAQIIGDNLVAMAQVDAVPAGRYARAGLVSLGVWDRIEQQVVQAANVRAALRFVQRGEVRFGVGYASDLVALPDLVEIYAFAPDTHEMILYSGAHLTQQGNDFMIYLQSVTAQDILGDWGFAPLPDLP